MCFSAPVSFTTSAVLAAIGVLCVRKTQVKQEVPFASIPFLFATQQFIEGMLWLVLPDAGLRLEQYWLTQAYAVFIGMVWPVLIPLSLFLIEPRPTRRRVTQAVFAIGVVVAVYTLSVIIRYGIRAEIVDACIVYQYPGDERPGMLTIYPIATCGAFFFSSYRSVKWIGAANLAGFLIAYYFYRLDYTSVWCFFAAIVSGLIYLHFTRNREREMAELTESALPSLPSL